MSTATVRKGRRRPAPPASYLELVREFSLRPIENQAEYEAASAVLDRLAVRGEDGLDAGERDYLDALSLFIEAYDDEHAAIPDGGTPLENLKLLMQANQMKTTDLGNLLGNRGLASLVLNGKRELSKAHIRLLADRFKVSPAMFL
jgi:HTH-type transcriptional regulator / antitoxin HigA